MIARLLALEFAACFLCYNAARRFRARRQTVELKLVLTRCVALIFRGGACIQSSHEQPDHYLRLCARKGVD